MNPTNIQLIGASLFAVALLHTFSTKFFERLAHTRPAHAGLWHLLGEVEVVFGFWAFVMMIVMFMTEGKATATHYLDTRNFTEPLFVFAIMVAAASKPILQAAGGMTRLLARLLPLAPGWSFTLVVLTIVPLLGSFITEPAAMTLAALLMKDAIFARASRTLKYALLGTLFVNISIGGTLTPYAAPPVMMVAKAWGFDLAYMLTQIGWKAALAVMVNALAGTFFFRKELLTLPDARESDAGSAVPVSVASIHLVFLVGVVLFAHHPAVFMGLFLFFLGYAEAYERYQNRLILREGLLVAFFLAGLVVLGGLQQWWLQRTLLGVEPTVLFFLATGLTAITDNAALTYLASLVQGVSPAFQYAIVAGAVTGGGLTIIANAPNPAGVAILKSSFDDESVSPLGLFLAALPPTMVAMLAFLLL